MEAPSTVKPMCHFKTKLELYHTDYGQPLDSNWSSPYRRRILDHKDFKIIFLTQEITFVYSKRIQFLSSPNA